MNKIISFIFFNFFLVGFGFSQVDNREQVYMHLNSQTFISGETMYFSAYCQSQMTGIPSDISKILYLELVGENGAVHQQKIHLNNGRGHSDFFITSTIPSGRYYLIAYTRWMKNFNDYFQCPVWIINPYESYPQDSDITQPGIEVFTPDSTLVAGVENVVGFLLKAADPAKYKGRIVSKNGETVKAFKIGRYGLGKLSFTPETGDSYQLILEDDEGKISFHDLPEVTGKGCLVLYKKNRDRLDLKCEVAGIKVKNMLNLTVFYKGNLFYHAEVAPNTYHTVLKNELPEGVYKIQYSKAEGNVLAERSIYVPPPIVKDQQLGKSYGTRQRITIDTKLDSGTYSISVRKKTGYEMDNHRHAIWSGLNQFLQSPVPASLYLSNNEADIEALMLASTSHPIVPTPEQVSLLPESREEILAGKILDSIGHPAVGKKISLSIPGEPYQLRIGESNEKGEFLIPFQSTLADKEAIITAVDFKNQFQIVTINPFLDKYPNFKYQLPPLDTVLLREIIKKNIRVQIENAYYEILAGKSVSGIWESQIPHNFNYLLDNYNRFSTLKETFTEYIITANVRTNRDYVIKTVYFHGLSQPEYPPLVLVDGVPMSGKNAIQLNPYKVESIGILDNQYFLGPFVADGVVDIKTFNNNYGGFKLGANNNHFKVPVKKVFINPEYTFPEYSNNIHDHLPDQRDQLFWDPFFEPNSDTPAITFYSSDLPGKYEMVIEGFTKKGKPLSKVYNFVIE